jgi:hypothetical protein
MDYKNLTIKVTFIGIPLLILLILGYDVLAIYKDGSEASISALIIKMSYKFPAFTFLLGKFTGFFEGHLFWRMKSNKMTEEIDNEK